MRIQGWWRGARSGVQILPPPDAAPDSNIEIADHPFVLEFPIRETSLWSITNYRRISTHRNLTLLLNVLLAGRTSFLPARQDHFWAYVSSGTTDGEFQWVQNFYFAKLGKIVTSRRSAPNGEPLVEIDAEDYFEQVGHDGQGLRVPSDLDEMICLYLKLSRMNRLKFDRATFWIDIASRLWNTSQSASLAARVAAIESLTVRGTAHSFESRVREEGLYAGFAVVAFMLLSQSESAGSRSLRIREEQSADFPTTQTRGTSVPTCAIPPSTSCPRQTRMLGHQY